MSSAGRPYFTDSGPSPRLHWATSGDTTRAKHAEMLEIDADAMLEWLKIMRDLVDRDLPDIDFTIARMAALKAWEKRRKLAQARLHYKYDPRRRRPGLVERDTRAQLRRTEELKAKLAVTREQLEARRSTEPSRHEAPRSSPSSPMPSALAQLPADAILAIREVLAQYPDGSDEILGGAFKMRGVRGDAVAHFVRAALELREDA